MNKRNFAVRLFFGAALLGLVAVSARASAPATAPSAKAAPEAAPELPRTRKEAAAGWSEDGLEKIKVKGLDVVYARPGASLAGYQKVMLTPVSVAFRRNWERSGGALGTRIRPADAQRIRDRLAKLVHEEMTKQLTAGGYGPATEPGDDVLTLDLSISDLYINAPDVNVAGRTLIYGLSAGEMTLVAELRDSSSGETMLRVYDHDTARESSRPRRLSSIENEVEARHMAAAWAKIFRRELDLARASK